MNAILDREAITKALRRDRILQKSLGLEQRYPTTRWFATIWGIWVFTLIVTPLPENFMLSWISLLMTAIFAAIFLGIDTYQNLLNQAQLAERIYNLLEKKPTLQVTQRPGSAHIVHPKFEADCQIDTALLLDEMVSSEVETTRTLEQTEKGSLPEMDPG